MRTTRRRHPRRRSSRRAGLAFQKVSEAKLEALEKLRKLQSIEPKEARAKEWRALWGNKRRARVCQAAGLAPGQEPGQTGGMAQCMAQEFSGGERSLPIPPEGKDNYQCLSRLEKLRAWAYGLTPA